ncbi:MAG: DUF1007 family protein [Candidatus Cloacimonetes bacterium]|nr:DUF1007 family protein [Candidatus Cloacimonadota bacterium]
MRKFVIIYFILFSIQLFSHPHVWIEYAAEVIFSEEGLEGLEIEWTFDEMFSWQIVMDYTEDHDFEISEEESKIIENEAFAYLAESGYFADFYVNGKKYEVRKVEKFHAECRGELLVYHFYIPWKVPVKKGTIYLKICFFDETIFCEVVPKKDGFKIKETKNISAEYSMPDRITYQLNFRMKK